MVATCHCGYITKLRRKKKPWCECIYLFERENRSSNICHIQTKFMCAQMGLNDFLRSRTSWSIISSICSIIHPSICSIIHLSHHGLFTPMGWRKSGIQKWCSGENNRKRWHTCQSPAMTGQMAKWCFTSIRSSIHPFMVCLLRQGGERVKYTYI